jgi:hypothetical protein
VIDNIAIDNEDTQYQLKRYAVMLCNLCAVWQANVRSIDCAYPMPESWGPSEAELTHAVIASVTARWVHVNEDVFVAGEEDSEEEADGVEDELLDVIESVALSDAYRHHLDLLQ